MLRFPRYMLNAVTVVTLTGCCVEYTDQDLHTLYARHGDYILAGEGPAWRCGASVVFLHGTDDRTLTELLPTLNHFRPPVIIFDDDATLTDASIDTLNQIKGLKTVDLGASAITAEGLKRLKPESIQAIKRPLPATGNAHGPPE